MPPHRATSASFWVLAALVSGCSEGRPGAAAATPNGGAGSANGGASGSGPTTQHVLVFSRTVGYRHVAIEAGIRALQVLAQERGFRLTATEDAAVFSATGLAEIDVVLFLNATGDVLDTTQELALEEFIRSGRGFVGVHAASDTEYDWPWYGGLVGAYFRDHPPVQTATVLVEDASHAATAHLPATWTRTDEWYAFQENPRERVHVLLSVDESTYSHDVGSMGADHPIAWCHDYDGGRAFYTGLGHADDSYQDPAFMAHLAGAIRWAAGG